MKKRVKEEITISKNGKVIDRLCPRCRFKLIVVKGEHGDFIGCLNWPICKYTKSLKNEYPKLELPKIEKHILELEKFNSYGLNEYELLKVDNIKINMLSLLWREIPNT